MGVFDIFHDDQDKIKVNVVGGPRDTKPGPAGIYKDGKLVWSPDSEEHEGKIVFKTAEDQEKARIAPSGVRFFETGATRSAQADKLDFRGFLSPIALRAFAEYMHKNRVQPDGSLRASDNWQKGIPLQSYMESMWRHFFAVWEGYEKGKVEDDDLAGLFFNVQGYMHEKGKQRSNLNAALSRLGRGTSRL